MKLRRLALAGATVLSAATAALSASSPVSAQTEAAPQGTSVTTLADPALNGTSGLALGVDGQSYWINQDAGWYAAHKAEPAAVWLIGPDGSTRAKVTLRGVTLEDSEDIAMGPDAMLYVADTGDAANVRGSGNGPRTEFAIYRFAPPATGSGQPTIEVLPQQLRFRYPDNAAHNVEAVLVDPKDGSIVLVEKTSTDSPAAVWRLDGAWDSGNTVTAVKAGTVNIAGATGASVDPARRFLVVRNAGKALAFVISEGESLTDALAGKPTEFRLPTQQQGEGIVVKPAIPNVIINSEGANTGFVAVSLPGEFLDQLRAAQRAQTNSVTSPLVGMGTRLIFVLGMVAIAGGSWAAIRRRRRRDTIAAPIDLRKKDGADTDHFRSDFVGSDS